MNQKRNQTVRLDLNNPVFQRQLFRLSKIDKLVKSPKTVMPDLIRHPEAIELLDSGFRRNDKKGCFSTFYETIKIEQRNILNTLRKLVNMTWQQVYTDHGLKWEAILSKKGPGGNKL